MPPDPRLAYVVDSHWRDGLSGVSTFIAQVHDTWVRDWDCDFIDVPDEVTGRGAAIPKKTPTTPGSDERTPSPLAPVHRPGCSTLRLAMGYGLDLIRHVRFAWSIRSRLKGRLIITNQFGCELLPIALRLVCPRAHILAIAHTHPDVGEFGRHPVRKAVERLNYRMVSDVIYNSHSVRQEWAVKLNKPSLKGRVIWYGIRAPDTRVPTGYPPRVDGVVDFVLVGRFVPWKGHLHMIELWRRAQPLLHGHCRLILVGDGPTLEPARRAVTDAGVDSSVIFTGEQAEGALFFNAGDVGLLSSVEPEAFGLVLLEAMSRGKPVVASRIGGVPEVVADGETGLLFNADDPAAATTALATMACDPTLRIRLGRAGRQRWEQYFTVDRMLSDYSLYFSSQYRDKSANRLTG